MPPILRLDVPDHNGEVDVKTAYIPGLAGFAIKISPGFFDNPKRGLPSVNGLMAYFSAETGLVEALLLDNGYLTDVRTAAAGAVAAKWLAREDAAVAAILGGGVQARLQLEALALVRPIREARIWARRGRSRPKPRPAEASAKLGIRGQPPWQTPAEAVRGADIIVTTTPATAPILQAEWLGPGPARHRHGLRCRTQERDRSGDLRQGRLCRRQPQPDPAARRTASRRRRGTDSRKPRSSPRLGQVIAGIGPRPDRRPST